MNRFPSQAHSAVPSAWVRLLPWAAALISAAAYFPILRNCFFFDDFNNLYNIANKGFWHFVLTPSGEHACFTRNLVFYVFYKLCGLDPRPYFASVLLTHLLNVYLLCRMIELLTEDPLLGFVGGALWGTCRVNEGALGFYSVYGQVLATLLTLWVLYDLLRRRQARISATRILCWCGLLLIGVTCFGSAIATAMAFPLIAFLLLPRSVERRRVTLAVASLLVTVPALYFGSLRLYAALYGAAANPAAPALHHLGYLVNVANMLAYLIVYGIADLLLSLWATDAAWQLPAAGYVAAATVIAAILTALAFGRVAARRPIAAFIVAVLAVYGIIAVGRAGLSIALGKPPAWGASSARYHYETLALLSVMLCLVVSETRRVSALRRLPLRLLLLAFAGTNPLLRVPPSAVIDHHTWARVATAGVLRMIDEAVRSAPAGQEVFIHNPEVGLRGPISPPESFPGWAAVFMIAHRDNALHNHQVRFVESDPKLLQALQAQGGRIATLVVAPSQVKRGPQ